ncbi:ABC transporter substrate-binding protein [Xylophilus sp. GW821-FHT01B05]
MASQMRSFPAPHSSVRRAVLATGASAFLGLAQAGASAQVAGVFPGPASSTKAPVRGGTLIAVVTPEPPTLVSAFSASAPVAIVASKLFDGLMRIGPDLELVPELAQSWSVASDGLSITLKLRRDVKWHDGKPFTSADVRYSMLEIWKKIHPHGKVAYSNVTGVDTPDPYTAVIRLNAPSPVALFALNNTSSPLLPKHIYEGTDLLRNPANVKPVGTGPFRFKEWIRGDRIVLERNPDYWDAGKPYLDGLVFRIIPDAAARSAAFERGDVQYGVQSPVDVNDLDRIAKLPSIAVETRGYEYLSTIRIVEFNLRNPVLADLRVRHAIAHAIDLQRHLAVVLRAAGKVATGPVSSALARYYTADVPRYAFDPKTAEQLLDAAGHPRKADGTRFALNIDWVPFGETNLRTAEFLRQSLKRVGIDARIRNQDLARYFQRIYTDYDFDLTVTSLSMFGDPQIGSERLVWSETILKGVPFSNASGYSHAATDGLIRTAHGETDPAKRVELYRKLQRQVQGDLPLLPLAETRPWTASNRKLQGLETTPNAWVDSLKGAWLAP